MEYAFFYVFLLVVIKGNGEKLIIKINIFCTFLNINNVKIIEFSEKAQKVNKVQWNTRKGFVNIVSAVFVQRYR